MKIKEQIKKASQIDLNKSYKTILKPVITEKATRLSEFNKVVFIVSESSNKLEIKYAVEKIFSVKVNSVNVIKIKGKSKSWWSCRLANKKGRYSTRKKWKKGFNYKKCVKKGQNSALPLQGNKSMFGGGLFKGKSTISTNFESGNINHIKNVQRKKDVLVVLEIENEPYPINTKTKYQNWFYFKSNDLQRKSMTYTIQNINVKCFYNI